jgi:hypothetical protein
MTTTSPLKTPERRGANHWFVESSRGTFGYYVRFVSGHYTCGCNGFRFRPHLACRHIEAIKRFRKEVAYQG